jgi:AcrR family transcriptional regulator
MIDFNANKDCACEDSCLCTREKILRCACELFANRAFKETTVQDICTRAESNIASVNYYFGNKEKLYCEAWEYAAGLTQSYMGVIDDTLPARAWLDRAVEQRIRAIFSDGPEGWLPKLIHNQHQSDRRHMSPEIKEKVLTPIFRQIRRRVEEYLGGEMDDLAMHSVAALVMGVMPGMVHLRYQLLKNRPVSPEEIDHIIANAKTYLFGGLDALKKARKKAGKETS